MTNNEDITMEDLLKEVVPDSHLLSPKDIMVEAANLIISANEEAREKSSELIEKGEIVVKIKSKYLKSLLPFIKEGIQLINKRNTEVKIHWDGNKNDPNEIIFTFRKERNGDIITV